MGINRNKIVHNSAWLYVRMLVVTLVTLYTSRIILNVLGAEDFGIYNVAGGVVAFLAVLSSALTTASQRFFNIKKGENDIAGLRYLFSISIKLHNVVSLVLLIVAESVGLLIVCKVLSFPPERYSAAIWVYQSSVIALLLSILKIPYMSLVITYERFSFIAWTSILDVCIKLGIAFCIRHVAFDKLVFYGFSFSILSALMLVAYVIYCNFYIISPSKTRYKDLLSSSTKELLSFSGWSLLGGTSSTLANHGVSLIFNVFYGLITNAAVGITNQVTNTVASFVSNVQLAFRPQLLQAYADNNKKSFWNLVYGSTKWSFYLILLVVIPILTNIDFVLDIWLCEVPNGTASFVSILLLYLVVESVSTPVYYAIEANGIIKRYQLILSLLYLLNVVAVFVCCFAGTSPQVALFTRLVTVVLIYVLKLFSIKKYFVDFSFKSYFNECMSKILVVGVMCSVYFILFQSCEASVKSFLIKSGVFILTYPMIVYTFGLNQQEKKYIINTVFRKLLQFISTK